MKKSSEDTTSRITAREIRRARKELGLTQRQLADLLGVAMNTVYRWENDMCPAQLSGVIRMALQYLTMQRALDDGELLRIINQHIDGLETMRKQLKQKRGGFESLRKFRDNLMSLVKEKKSAKALTK